MKTDQRKKIKSAIADPGGAMADYFLIPRGQGPGGGL